MLKESPLLLRVTSCLRDYVSATTGVPQIADDIRNGIAACVAPVPALGGSATGLSATDARWPVPVMNATYVEAGAIASRASAAQLQPPGHQLAATRMRDLQHPITDSLPIP